MLSFSASYTRTSVNNASSPYTILDSDDIIGITTIGGVVNVTLPQISLIGGNNYKKYYIVDEGGNAIVNNIIISTTGADTILNTTPPYTINVNNTSISFYSDGTSNWVIL